MRGKYANGAEKRRALESLEARAITAERERDNLRQQLSDAVARHEESSRLMRAYLADARRERDAAASPRIAELENLNNTLRARWLQYKGQLDHERRDSSASEVRLAALLGARFGLKSADALDLIRSVQYPEDSRIYVQAFAGSRDPERIRRIERARGWRGNAEPVSENRPAVVGSARQFLREAARIDRKMQESILIDYVYEDATPGAERTIVLEQYQTGELIIAIEPNDLSWFVLPASEREKFALAAAPRPTGKETA